MARTVAIIGGGIAGLSAAHELIERGFAVDVYEARQVPGGKARSIPIPGTGTADGSGSRGDLPGEHGFRFFPRFYKHVVDTMGRIPYGRGQTVADNLVDTTRLELARFDKPPVIVPCRSPRNLRDVKLFLDDFDLLYTGDLGVSREELALFASRVWQIVTSCRERRLTEYEKIDWWDFIDAGRRSAAYQNLLGHGITRSLVAAKAHLASTKTIGDIFVQLLFDIAKPGPSTDRVLNGPTSDVWIGPWVDYLTSRGVRFHFGAKATAIACEQGRIWSVTCSTERGSLTVRGDWYLLAIPVERMADLVDGGLLTVDPSLANLRPLREATDWMNGIQLYLAEDLHLVHGHTIHVDSPWALTSINQSQFWSSVDLTRYGDGGVKDVLSVDISEWEQKGLNGKTAKECSPEEVRLEVWEQLKRGWNVGGKAILEDSQLHRWFLDPDVHLSDVVPDINDEPLLVNLVDTWKLRPEAVTSIPNLFLAADYVRTYTDLATMEAANEAARRAVNGILGAAGSDALPCAIWNLHEPEIFAPWRAIDRLRYQQGLPWDDTLVVAAMSALHSLEQAIAAVGVDSTLPRPEAGRALWAAPAHRPVADESVDRRAATAAEQIAESVSSGPAVNVAHDPSGLSPAIIQTISADAARARSGRVRIIPL